MRLTSLLIKFSLDPRGSYGSLFDCDFFLPREAEFLEPPPLIFVMENIRLSAAYTFPHLPEMPTRKILSPPLKSFSEGFSFFFRLTGQPSVSPALGYPPPESPLHFWQVFPAARSSFCFQP